MTAGHRLRSLRESLGLTIRDVEAASQVLAHKRGNDDFFVPISRLSDFETKDILPSIFRLYSLAVIYRRDMRELMAWYGVDLDEYRADLRITSLAKSHVVTGLNSGLTVSMPVKMDPSFQITKTSNLGRMIERWGIVPLAFLEQFKKDYTYGFIGTEDFTMYPLLLPGSFVQVDEQRTRVEMGAWRSEFERPIYFVETRDGFVCCWCALDGNELLLQPHPLSPATARTVKHPQEAEVLGQVVAVAMRLDEWSPARDARAPRALN
jgi:transcriptional regulator with XRE-family HTH domain